MECRTIKATPKSVLTFVLLMVVVACYYDNREDILSEFPPTDCDTLVVQYSADIQPILQANCYSCHNSSITNGGLDLTTYPNVKTVIDNGKLIDRITRPSGTAGAMPPGGPLSDCNIAKIKAWANQDAPDN